MPLFETVTDLRRGADVLRRRRYGVIEVERGQLVRVRLRPLPKIVSLPELYLTGRWYHRRRPGDRIWLYYNQPRRFSNFIALKYIVSGSEGTLRTLRAALAVLDEIARIKRTDALLCDAANLRISDRLFRRWGWEAHKPQAWHRNFIKRFYGEYPPPLVAEEEGTAEPAGPSPVGAGAVGEPV